MPFGSNDKINGDSTNESLSRLGVEINKQSDFIEEQKNEIGRLESLLRNNEILRVEFCKERNYYYNRCYELESFFASIGENIISKYKDFKEKVYDPYGIS